MNHNHPVSAPSFRGPCPLWVSIRVPQLQVIWGLDRRIPYSAAFQQPQLA